MSALIDRPAFITLELANGTRIQGRHTRYSDPARLSMYEPFVMEDAEGTTSYVHGAAILRLVVFPLDGPAAASAEAEAPSAAPLEG